jgi:hypothetical protein
MKESNHKPVQVVLTYKAGSPSKNSLHAKIVSENIEAKANDAVKLDDNDKRVRRYSFDDNGGGYLGL